MSVSDRIAWGIIGTGAIAHIFAQALANSRTGRLVAVGSRSAESAQKFAQEIGTVRGHGSYDALLADTEVQAVHISTPHPLHAKWCRRAAQAGKHILCEKPLTMTHAEAVDVANVAREHGVFLMEAFMYRCHPQTARIVQLVRSGSLGRVGVIQATFSFRREFEAAGRHFNRELGGGGILDVGCYTVSIARLIAGAARGMPFADPLELTGVAELHPETRTDLFAIASARFPDGVLAQLATGVGLTQDSGLRVFGTEAWLHVANPFTMGREGGSSTIRLTRGEEVEEIITTTDEHLFALEADAVGDAILRGEKECAFMPVADTLGNMAALDAWRRAVGLTYACDQVQL